MSDHNAVVRSFGRQEENRLLSVDNVGFAANKMRKRYFETDSSRLSETRPSTMGIGGRLLNKPQRPVLLLSYSPRRVVGNNDRFEIQGDTVIGRHISSDIVIDDSRVSNNHFLLRRMDDGRVEITDLQSTNGTYINGRLLHGGAFNLSSGTVIRAGRSIFVFHEDRAPLLKPPPSNNYGIIGSFHCRELLYRLKNLSKTKIHFILAGDTGVGKELAFQAFSAISGLKPVIHNCARFATEEEAAGTLFGVVRGVFTDVHERMGLIEQANGKVLFLDEAHHLPMRLQKGLLRIVEDMTLTRIGDNQLRKVNVRFVLATNDSASNYGLAHDLVARMSVVPIATLKERVADIPDIFKYILYKMFKVNGLDPSPVLREILADHFECLCLDGFEFDNTRGIIKLSREIVDGIITGASPREAIRTVFEDRYANSSVVRRKYENLSAPVHQSAPVPQNAPIHQSATVPHHAPIHQSTPIHSTVPPQDVTQSVQDVNIDAQTLKTIVDSYYLCKGVVADMHIYLRNEHGIRTSRHRISKILDSLNLPRLKRDRS